MNIPTTMVSDSLYLPEGVTSDGVLTKIKKLFSKVHQVFYNSLVYENGIYE